MSFNICALSGTIIHKPVVSKKTGHVFDKNVIEAYLAMTGKCPITNTDLSKDDLIEVKGEYISQPRTANAASLPGLFKDLQNDFNNHLLEVNNLKKELNAAKNELSHALYQYDASCKVIARLIRERDLARGEIVKYKEELDEEIEEEEENK